MIDQNTVKTSSLRRLSAFTNSPEGGNPAGVWVGENLPSPEQMQQIAADVGFSETAFIAPLSGKVRKVRYYSPEAEVAFCGHATIASGVALGHSDGVGIYQFETSIGSIPVEVSQQDHLMVASLTSVEPRFEKTPKTLLDEILKTLGWTLQELDLSIPPALAFAGNWHLVLATKTKQRLDQLDYDFDSLKRIMLEHQLTTLQLIWRESEQLMHSRNPFPVGGVIEDAATGAAAVALGGYLREAGLIKTPRQIDLLQGEIMGRPSQLKLTIPKKGGIKVSGSAVVLD